MKNKLMELPKEKLVEKLEYFYLNLVKDPKYNIYSKAFFVEYLKNILEIFKRYKNLNINLLLFKFDPSKIEFLKKALRKSDLIAKYDNAFIVIIFQTGEVGAYKVKNKIEKNLNTKVTLIEIQINTSLNKLISEIDRIVKFFK